MSRRALAWALAVSVALNLFGLGWVAAKSLGRGARSELLQRRPGPGRRGRDRWLGPEARRLTQPQRQALRSARRAAREQLEREPFEAAALDAALADLRRQSDALQRIVHEQMTERAATMTPAQRRDLARRYFRRRGGRRGRAGPSRAGRRGRPPGEGR